MSSDKIKPRLVLYGLGQYNQLVARFAVQKGWPIVAAFNRAGPKVGQDIGRLIGLPEIGVAVQDADTASYDGLDADIGVVTITDYLKDNFRAYERLLNAGLNVISHGVEDYYPYGNDPEIAARIDGLAKQNGVTFSGSGIWDMSRIWSGILAAGPCTELRALFHQSVTDATRGGKALLLRTGAGQTVQEFEDAARVANAANAYKTITQHVLAALGYTVTDSKSYLEPIIAPRDFDCELLGRVIPAGDCIGTRSITETSTAQGVTATSHVEVRLITAAETEHMFWSVDGKPVSRVRVEREDARHATAAALFNRIPDVIAAAPGIVLISQMGPLKPSALL
jgi:4-hydroxy-tetrahydrodipicolinate reductase